MTGTVFLTGATGFLGSRIARQLSDRGEHLHVTARAGSDRTVLDGLPRVAWHDADLGEPETMERALAEAAKCAATRGHDLRVMHIAALISYRTRDTDFQRRFNLEGTRAILRSCIEHGVRRLLHVSSIVAVAHSEDGAAKDERASFNGANIGVDYVTTKRAAEELVRDAQGELDVVVASPGAIFGPTTRESNSAELLDRVARGRAPLLGPPGGTSVVGVEDTAAGCILVLDRGARGERYILTERYLSHFDLLRRVAEASGTRGPSRKVPRVLWPVVRGAVHVLDRLRAQDLITPQALTMLGLEWNLDASKAREELGWQPRPFDEVLSQTLASLPNRSQ